MSDYYEVNQFDEVVPIISGRRSNNTREYRDLTEFEKQLIEEKRELDKQIEELQTELDKANERLKTVSLPDVSCPDSSGSVCPICKGEKWVNSENGFYCEPCRNCGGNGKLTN